MEYERAHIASDAPAIAASLMYSMILAPLQSAFGEFGSLITAELETLPLHNRNDVIRHEFERSFHLESLRHA